MYQIFEGLELIGDIYKKVNKMMWIIHLHSSWLDLVLTILFSLDNWRNITAIFWELAYEYDL